MPAVGDLDRERGASGGAVSVGAGPVPADDLRPGTGAAEIKLIETYLPKAAGEEEIVAGVRAAIAEMTPAPAMKDMGSVMKAAMARFAAAGMRVDGKVVSEAVKKELAGK